MSEGTASNTERMTRLATSNEPKKRILRSNFENEKHEQTVTESLCVSLEKTPALYDETIIAPAHFSDSAMRDGMYTTPSGSTEPVGALSMEKGESIEFIIVDMPPFPTNHTNISTTNLDGASLEAFELGTDNCTVIEGVLPN